jgi:hypothetical protein
MCSNVTCSCLKYASVDVDSQKRNINSKIEETFLGLVIMIVNIRLGVGIAISAKMVCEQSVQRLRSRGEANLY